MSSEELRKKIAKAINSFETEQSYLSADMLLAGMGYTSSRRLPLQEKTPQEFLDTFNKESKLIEQKALIEKWMGIDLLFQLTGADLDLGGQPALPLPTQERIDQNITSYLFFALELQDSPYTRTELSNITREINKCFHVPVMLVIKHGAKISIAIIHRRPNKRESYMDVLEKVTLIKDIDIKHPHRAHIEILADLSLQEIITKPSPPKNMQKLHDVWRSVLDLKELNKNFYKELSNWYFWAIKECVFPPEAGTDETRNPTSIIRLITRLIFVWFIKEKGLVPDDLFEKSVIQELLKSLKKDESTYYKAILQNLFFATLNQEDLDKRQFVDEQAFQGKNKQYGVFNVFRYQDFFNQPQEALSLFRDIPFLNGGLFECLDRERETGEIVPEACEKEICRVDGFSGRFANPLCVPNKLFFSEEHIVDLNQDYGTANTRYKVRGLIDLLHSYKFTIEENTPLEEEVALDPELLGRTFENLLASYNPETQTTARKATGSYYTPREIVNYMVDESLIAYFNQKLVEFNPKPQTQALVSTQPPLSGDHQVSLSSETIMDTNASPYEQRLRRLFDHAEHENPFDQKETDVLLIAIDTIKVLDPACGSGAFPMGVLHRLVFLLGKLDPHNQLWKTRQLQKADQIEDPQARESALQAVKAAFESNELDYGRKMYLIQNCIYGVDIQPIAVQIAKLRFFISLIVDQKVDYEKPNWGIASLPNLESKFVAANSLLGIAKPDQVEGHQMALGDNTIEEIQKELFAVRENHFNAHTRAQKRACRDKDKQLRDKLAKELRRFGWSATSASQLAEWDPYAQNTSAEFFDPEWMFNMREGFDVIVANPPYLGEKGHKEMFRVIKKSNLGEYYLGKMDLFYFFFHLALNIGNQNAQIAFITTNYYPTASGAKKLRKDLKERASIIKLINFNELKIFESAMGQHNMISILCKRGKIQPNAQTCITKHNGVAYQEILESILNWHDEQTDYYSVIQADLFDGEECYIRISGASSSTENPIQMILQKVKNQGIVLGSICNVNQGIVTGADKVSKRHIKKYKIRGNVGDGIFVVDSKEIEKLNLTDDEKVILKPWFKNSDIKQYSCACSPNEFVFYLARDITNPPKKIITQLFKFKPILQDRREVVNNVIEWWGLQWPRERVIFESPKIVAPQRSPINTFGYNEIPWYASADVYFITEKDKEFHLKYLLALLNSKLYYLWLYYRGKRKGEMLELYQKPLSEIPIKKISSSEQKPFIDIVDKILDFTKDEDYQINPTKKAEVDALVREIDQMVYHLYGLTEEEIAIVEGKR